MANTFTTGTQIYNTYETLSDMKWHCTKCDLESAQAADFRYMINKGIEFEQDDDGNNYKKIFCSVCDKKRVHRKLKA